MSSNKRDEDVVRGGQATYEMYAEMPDDGQRYEVIDGVLEMMPPGVTTTHQAIARELLMLLRGSCQSEYIVLFAPLDVILTRTNVLQPDVLMVRRSRSAIVTNRGIEGAPDLVVEILSPSTRKRDKVVKSKVYAKHGVPEYWMIDPLTKTLEQYGLTDGGYYELENEFGGEDAVASDKLPCVSFPVSKLFAEMWQ